MPDFVPYEIAPSVRKLAGRLFNPQRATQVLQLLASTELPMSGRNCERVHLGILLICGSGFARFERELREAAKDWRDTLCAAGLENENWREVLFAKGIAVTS